MGTEHRFRDDRGVDGDAFDLRIAPAAETLAAKGARVILACRNAERAARARDEVAALAHWPTTTRSDAARARRRAST